MSYHAGDDPDVAKPWFMRKTVWIIAAIAFCLLVLGLGIFTYVGMKRIPEIGGGITIEADPDTRIYVGEKLVGTTQVSFSWEELFGDTQHQPLAVELPFPAGAVTPELVSGPGAVVLESQALGGGGTGINALTMMTSGDKYLIRGRTAHWIKSWLSSLAGRRLMGRPVAICCLFVSGKGQALQRFTTIPAGQVVPPRAVLHL
jgi:hypothetical protein